ARVSGTGRGVDHQVDLAIADVVHDVAGILSLAAGVGDLRHDLALHTIATQHTCGARGGEHVEAQGGQSLDREDQGALVAVGDGDEDVPLRRQLTISALLGFRERGTEVRVKAHDLTGGLHFRAQQGVQHLALEAAETVERQHGFLDCDRVTDRQRATVAIGRKDALLLELGDGRAQHDAGCGLRHLHARGLGHERRSAGGARVGLDDVEDVVLQRVLDVHQTLHADALGQLAGGFPDLFDVLLPQRHRWQRTGGVTGVDTGLLNVLHHAAEVDVLAIAESVDIDLDGGIQEAVDQDRVLVSDLRGARDVVTQAGLVVDDLHAASAEDVGRADQHRVTDIGRDLTGLLEAGGGAEGRGWQLGVTQDLAELAAVLGQVDGLRGGADDRHTSVREALRQAQRGLATELDDHARDGAGLGLRAVDLHDVLEGQRLEVQAISSVVVGGDGLRVAVDHHGLVANAGELEGRVNAGVVELNALADAVRAGAQDDDLFLILLRLDLGLGVRVQLIGAVVVRGLRLKLAGAGVHGLEDRVDAEGPAQGAHAVLPCELRTQG